MPLLNFMKPMNQLEEGGRTAAPVQCDAGEPEKKCPNCHKEIPLSRLWLNDLVCPCGYHFRMKARQRIRMIADKGSFRELFAGVKAENPLNFPGYRDKLETVRVASGEKEAVVCGHVAVRVCRSVPPAGGRVYGIRRRADAGRPAFPDADG